MAFYHSMSAWRHLPGVLKEAKDMNKLLSPCPKTNEQRDNHTWGC